MKIENPFESGHIKNYILLYASVIVIMVLFFTASSLFNDVKKMDKKVFNTDVNESALDKTPSYVSNKTTSEKFKLLDSAY
jgi:hypothetical protein